MKHVTQAPWKCSFETRQIRAHSNANYDLLICEGQHLTSNNSQKHIEITMNFASSERSQNVELFLLPPPLAPNRLAETYANTSNIAHMATHVKTYSNNFLNSPQEHKYRKVL